MQNHHTYPVPLKNVAKVFAGAPSSLSRENSGGHAVDVITVRCLEYGAIVPEGLIHAELPEWGLKRARVHEGDILLPARSTSLKFAVVPPEWDGGFINATVIAIRCSEQLNPRVLVAYLSHPIGRAELEARCQSGTHQVNVTVGALEGLSVPVPPLDEQKKLVALLEAADEACDTAVRAASLRRAIAGDWAVQTMTQGPKATKD